MNQNAPSTAETSSANAQAGHNSSADLAARWAESRRAYPLYAALATQFGLADLPHPTDELPPMRPTRAIFDRDLKWLDEIDEKLMAFQIRQLPSELLNRSEENLRAFIQRQLKRSEKTSNDRDKIDLLLVQYFAQCAPDQLYRQDIELEDVARVLQPVLGTRDVTALDWCQPLYGILNVLEECRSLRDLLEAGLIEQSRLMKDSAGSNYYEPSALVAFCRFNFLLRRAFIRLLHADLKGVKDAIDALEARGAKTADCRRAGFSAAETTTELRRFCESWRQPFQKDYTESSVNASFEQLLALRADLDEALAGKSRGIPATQGQTQSEWDGRTESTLNSATAGSNVTDLQTQDRFGQAGAQNRNSRATDSSTRNSLLPKPKITFGGAASAAAEADRYLEAIWEQLRVLPSSHARSMSTISLEDTKVLLSSWESDAFTGEDSPESEDLRRAVLARALLSVAMEQRKRSGEETALTSTIAHAQKETAYFQGRIEQAKQSKNAEAAVNLAISAKRLLALMQEAEKLKP